MIHEFGQVLNSVFIVTVDIKLITRIQLQLSHLNKQRYNHKFKNCMNPNCICSSENDSKFHFFCIATFTFQEKNTFYKLKEIVINLHELSDQNTTQNLLFGHPYFTNNHNCKTFEIYS